MKQLLIGLFVSLAVSTALAAEAQKVCIDKIGKDGKVVMGKDGKPQQDCKMMKVHRKLDTETKVPAK